MLIINNVGVLYPKEGLYAIKKESRGTRGTAGGGAEAPVQDSCSEAGIGSGATGPARILRAIETAIASPHTPPISMMVACTQLTATHSTNGTPRTWR